MRRPRGCGASRAASRRSTNPRTWTWPASSHRSPGRAVRRTACRPRRCARTSARTSHGSWLMATSAPEQSRSRATAWSRMPPRLVPGLGSAVVRGGDARRGRHAGRTGRRETCAGRPPAYRPVDVEIEGRPYAVRTGSVAIAAITSCTNTSNPTVMVGAGLLARNAVARGLRGHRPSRRRSRPARGR